MTTPNQVPASYVVNYPNQTQQVQLMQYSGHREMPDYLVKIRRTAIIQIIGGVLLVVFGIVAIILLANWSYFATPIWSGLVFYILTGSLGVVASFSKNKCAIAGYITMSIFSCLMALALTEMYIWAAIWEEGYYYYNYGYTWICHPRGYASEIVNCAKSEAARQVFDALIASTGFFLFVLSIVAASFGCCAKCACCQRCCGGGCSSCCAPPPPNTSAFVVNGGFVEANAVGPQQGGVQYAQPGMFVVQPSQTVAIPPPGTGYPHVAIPGPQAPPPAYPTHMPSGQQLPGKGNI